MPYSNSLSMLRRLFARGALCLALISATSAGAAGAGELSVRLSAGPTPGAVVFDLSNDGAQSVFVLRRDTPLAAVLTSDAFDIRDARIPSAAGERVPFGGRLYKRRPPGAGDFVEIAPGRSISATIDLRRYYDVPNAGDYRIDYRGDIEHTVSAVAAGRSRDAALSGTRFHVEGPIVALEPGPATFRARPPRFNGCSAAHQDALVAATTAAEALLNETVASLDGLAEQRRATSPRYRRWFGAYTAARYAAVTDNYTAILGALSGETLAYDCTCSDDAFAYVFPSAPYDIYMCPTFFRANLFGTDSRAGTVIHELSHFTVLAGTRDFRYGQQSVAALAASDPGRAIGNADSYEYFAENTPALSMADDSPGLGGVPDDGGLPALPLDNVFSASLAQGDSMTFTVTGADSIALDSVTGDADLFFYASPSFDTGSLVCSSVNGAGSLDVCAVADEGTYYIAIRAYSDTRFEIVARSRGGRAVVQSDEPADEGTFATQAGGSGGGSGGIGWAWLLVGGSATLRRMMSCRPAARVLVGRRSGS